MLEFRVVNYCSNAYYIVTSYIVTSPLSSTYLWKDGTLNKGNTGWTKAGKPINMYEALGYWRTQQEAQQFLDCWMPRKKQLTISEVKTASGGCEAEALDCSIEHWKQNVLDVDNAQLGSSYCAVCERAAGKERKSGVERCERCVVNNYEWFDVNCCEEYENFRDNRTEENAIAMLNKLVLIRNKKYGNVYEEKMMVTKIIFDDGVEVELSKKTTERLRKELVKPKVEWKHGDVVKTFSSGKRIILKINGCLKSFNEAGDCMASNEVGGNYVSIKEGASSASYQKLYNVFNK